METMFLYSNILYNIIYLPYLSEILIKIKTLNHNKLLIKYFK